MNARRGLAFAIAAVMLVPSAFVLASSGSPATAADPCVSVREDVPRHLALLDAAAAKGGLNSRQRTLIADERAIDRAALAQCTPKPSPSSPAPSPTSAPSPTPSDPGTSPSSEPSSGPSPEPTASPSPTGTPTDECPPFPAFPDANCTGWQHTGVTLHDCGTDMHLVTPGAVYDSCRFRGMVRIRAAGITIRRSLVLGVIARHDSMNGDCQGLLVEDVEVTGLGDQAPIGDCNDMTIRRAYVHDAATGIGGGDGVTIVDSYVTRMIWTTGAHQAAVGFSDGHHSRIEHNRLECFRVNTAASDFQQGCSSALSIYTEGSPPDDMVVRHNFLATAGGYCTYAAGPTGVNITYEANVFSRTMEFPLKGGGTFHNDQCGLFGPVTAWAAGNQGNVWVANTWDDSGSPVNP